MSSTGQYNDLLYRLGWLTLTGALLVGVCLFTAWYRLPSDQTTVVRAVDVPEWAERPDTAGWDWSLFQNRDGSIGVETGSLARRLRLAGTFFAYGSESDSRKAVLDDLVGGEQHVVSENDEVSGVAVVVRIYGDRVVLRTASGEEQQLWLGFAKPAGGGTAGGSDESSSIASGTGGSMSGLFGGRQVGEHRWVFERQALLDYYQELRDEPERLLQVFDSLKPIYDDQSKIEGYQLGIEGEHRFFEAVGMVEGDVVRTVNSMKMTNRSRAEYFIKEFVADRCNVFVLDIERQGQPLKVIYQVR